MTVPSCPKEALLHRVRSVLGLAPNQERSKPWLAGVVALAAALVVVAVAQVSHSATPSAESSASKVPGRVVHFPKDRSMGILHVQDPIADQPISTFCSWIRENDEWTFLGEAKGDVSVPGGKRLWLTVSPGAVADLTPLSQLRPDELHKLSFHYGTVGKVRLQDLAGLRGLKDLDMFFAEASDSRLRAIQGFKSLTTLITPKGITNAGLASVAELSSLKRLYIKDNQITNDGLAALARLTSLEELEVGGPNITDAGLVHLAKLPSLKYLSLWGKNLSDAGLAHLTNVPSLRILQVSRLPITDAGLKHLSSLNGLERLGLYGTKVTDAGMAHLKALRSLRKLELWGTQVGDAGTAHLKEIKTLDELHIPCGIPRPNEPFHGLTDAGLANLSELGNLKSLKLQGVGGVRGKTPGSPISDAGLKSLTKLASLEELTICGDGVTDAGMDSIAQLSHLKRFSIVGCYGVSDKGLASLARLKSLNSIDIVATGMSMAGLGQLNGLPNLLSLDVYIIDPVQTPLDLSGLRNLEHLAVHIQPGGPKLHDEDLDSISHLTNLRMLQLGGEFSDTGMAKLAALTSLRRLNLGGKQVTDKSLMYLSGMRDLRDLSIQGSFTDAAVPLLAQVKSLDRLDMKTYTPLSPGAIKRLQMTLPNAYITVSEIKEQKPPRKAKAQQAAPAFSLKTLDGKEVKLEDYRGKVLVLDFWGTWCGPCVASAPALRSFYQQLSRFKDFAMIGVAMDDSEALLRQRVNDLGFTWPQARVGKLSPPIAADYGVTGVPTYIVIGPDGKILFSEEHDLNKIGEYLEKMLEERNKRNAASETAGKRHLHRQTRMRPRPPPPKTSRRPTQEAKGEIGDCP